MSLPKYKYTIDDMCNWAKNHGGECLSEVFQGISVRLQWKCSAGHIFEATPEKIRIGRWCSVCGQKRASESKRISIDEIHAIAIARKGKCISDHYEPHEKLKWQCEFDHIWDAELHNIKSGSWCPKCGSAKSGRKRLTIEQMHAIAASHGGYCLSTVYINSDEKLTWRCAYGHEWEALPLSVKKGHWCSVCAGQETLAIEKIKIIAINRGGECLSENCDHSKQRLTWKCSEGHIWEATYGNISFGRWCPECSSGVGERICRSYFEQLFAKPFPKSRPEWLINTDGFQMELDGFCADLRLAFEHQGRQHSEQIDFFHSTNEQFQKRQLDDESKKQLCKKHGIVLIEIPQIPDNLNLPDIGGFIINQCLANGINTPNDWKNIDIQLRDAYSPSARERLNSIKDIALTKGGRCLSTTYINNSVKMRFICKENHEWETSPSVLLKGHWCPKCSSLKTGKSRRLTMTEMHKMAEEHGGKCLSTEYINANKALLWECSKGHQWYAIPNSIKRGSWCNVCVLENRSEIMKNAIKNRKKN